MPIFPSQVSDTYIPVATPIANIAAVSFGAGGYWLYTKIGNIVFVSGQVQVTTTIAGSFQVNMTLPIPSNFLTNSDLSGNATGVTSGINIASMFGVAANTVQMIGQSSNALLQGYRVFFMYVIR